MNVGDVVKHFDADESSIPAYRSMYGRIVEIKQSGERGDIARIDWFDSKTGASLGRDAGYRRVSRLALVNDNPVST